MATVMNPPIPYRGFLGGSCRAGTLIQINAFVPNHANRFAINFLTSSGDNAFHFNPRFGENIIVLNTSTRGAWGGEERHGLGALQRGQYFELKILVENDKFMVAVNGHHHCQFRHRLPKEHINQVEVTGDVQIQMLTESSSFGPPAITNPPVPFLTPISGGLTPGKKVVVMGRPTGNSFSVNVQQTFEQQFRNVGLHVNPRFNEHAIVMNDCTNGSWGHELRTGVTLLPGQPFTLEIISHPHAFEVRLNGVTVTHFAHRNPILRPLHSLNVLNIVGDVALQQVFI